MIDWEQVNWGTVLLSAVTAVFTGAAGGYYSNKFTDRRRKDEIEKEEFASFKDMTRRMSPLLRAIRDDLQQRPDERWIYISPNNEDCGRKNLFVYWWNFTPHILNQLAELGTKQLVYEDPVEKYRRYMLSDKLVRFLLAWQPDNTESRA